MAEGYKADELKARSKRFAIAIVRLLRDLPRTEEARILGRQLLRYGTSVAANYRAACRASSKAEFIAKLGLVVEEIDETVFWIELLRESATFPLGRFEDVETEANELLAILPHRGIQQKDC